MRKRWGWLQVIHVSLALGILCGCAIRTPNTSAPLTTNTPTRASIPPTPTSPDPVVATDTTIPAKSKPQPADITFEVTFDQNHHCVVNGPAEVPPGDYLFRLTNQSDRKVDMAVTHLIEGHTYQDLLDLQNEAGEPFIKVYWMSQPYYFTHDHQVWTYSLEEAGEHVILVLQHMFVGSWICDPFMVTEAETE